MEYHLHALDNRFLKDYTGLLQCDSIGMPFIGSTVFLLFKFYIQDYSYLFPIRNAPVYLSLLRQVFFALIYIYTFTVEQLEPF